MIAVTRSVEARESLGRDQQPPPIIWPRSNSLFASRREVRRSNLDLWTLELRNGARASALAYSPAQQKLWAKPQVRGRESSSSSATNFVPG